MTSGQADEAQHQQILEPGLRAEDVLEDEEWILTSTADVPEERLQTASGNPYLDFQLRTRFGTLTFEVRPRVPSEATSVAARDESVVLSQQQSVLFRLPAELRQQIYKCVFRIHSSGPAVYLTAASGRSHVPSVLTSLLVCRRFLEEADGLFYSTNRLLLADPAPFVASLGPRRREAVTKITLTARSAGSVFAQMQCLHALQHLKSLHLQRCTNIKFMDVSSWAIMAPQMVAELQKMTQLTDLAIHTPEATGVLTQHDLERQEKLTTVDQRLYDAVSNLR